MKPFDALTPLRPSYVCSKLFHKFMPSPVRSVLNATVGRSWTFACPVCEEPVGRFFPLPPLYFRKLAEHRSELRTADFETCNVHGYECAHCEASDRERLYALYLADRLPSEAVAQHVFGLLDIAPAASLSTHIRRKYQIRYRTADLFQQNVDDRVDITAMRCYEDESFDAFICSHVLEHVDNDHRAMRELWRVLRPGGWGIAMVPIHLRLNDIDEHPTRSEAERWKYFGQGDHVRVYSKDGFVGRLQDAGFRVLQLDLDYFGRDRMLRAGVSLSSVLYVVEKPSTDINRNGVAAPRE